MREDGDPPQPEACTRAVSLGKPSPLDACNKGLHEPRTRRWYPHITSFDAQFVDCATPHSLHVTTVILYQQ